MRFFTLVSAFCALAVSAAPEAANDIVDLFHAFNPTASDYLYTTSRGEYDNAILRQGYAALGVACRVFSDHAAQTVPFYRLYSITDTDHFYTISEADREDAEENLGYDDQGLAGYVYREPAPDSVPFFEAYNERTKTHFYSTDFNEIESLRIDGYIPKGVAAHVLRSFF